MSFVHFPGDRRVFSVDMCEKQDQGHVSGAKTMLHFVKVTHAGAREPGGSKAGGSRVFRGVGEVDKKMPVLLFAVTGIFNSG